MNPTSPATHRRLSLWHIFLFVIVVFGVFMIAQALAERRYALAGVAAAVLAVGLPIAARMKRLRASLRGDNDQARRL